MTSAGKFIVVYYIAVSLILFFAMGYDKLRAKKEAWRISEASLFTLALIGGGIGGFFGMFLFHHKNRKPLFYIVFLFSVIIHIALVYFINDIFNVF
ncbi:MAG: DUF1294 domain-containing protein [Lachnospiraceae bacterium]|nr:DUF1294 domain-containing protein [Lachnospiraceae bacterium]